MVTVPKQSGPTNDGISSVLTGVCDLNGCYRGKRSPIDHRDKLLTDGIRMPLSVMGADIWGQDVFGNEQVFDTGDTDGICLPTELGAILCDWAAPPHYFIPMTMYQSEGQPYLADPRQALKSICQRYEDQNITAVAAMELEFYFIPHDTQSGSQSHNPATARTAQALEKASILAMDNLHALSPILDSIHGAAQACNIRVESTISESGPGQYEITLHHQPNVVRLADDILLLKRIIRHIAEQHHYHACFMAKPFGKAAGNGLHTHISLINRSGKNLFDNGSELGNTLMQYAVNGLVKTLPDATLVFAPHANSYKRLRPLTHAPTNIAWGYDNRTTSIRIPAGNPKARRIEHRVAGADANPYLVLAVILAGMEWGMAQKELPPKAIIGNAYEQEISQISDSWQHALNTFKNSAYMRDFFDESLIRLFSACKAQEIDTFANDIGPLEYTTYLQRV